MKLLLLSLVLLISGNSLCRTAWRGIVPGITTRQEVVRLLGKCAEPETPCTFIENGQHIRIIFAGGAIGDLYECARKIDPETVLLIEITPDKPSSLKRVSSPTKLKPLGPLVQGFRTYIDEQLGLVLKTNKGKVIELNYVATPGNRSRCTDYYKNPQDFVQVVTHCPPVTLECPAGEIKPGDRITFRASGIQDPKLTMLWKLSGGKIISGQNSSAITVDTAGLGGQNLSVTVEATGSCTVESSCEVLIKRRSP